MAITNIDDWSDFFYKVGEDFYDLVHGSGGDENTNINSAYITYQGAYRVQLNSGQSRDYGCPCIGQFSIIQGQSAVFRSNTLCTSSNYISSYNDGYYDGTFDVSDFNLSIDCTDGFVNKPYRINNNYFQKPNPYDTYTSNIFNYNYNFKSVRHSTGVMYMNINASNTSPISMRYYDALNSTSSVISLIENYNGYEYYFSASPANFSSNGYYPTSISAPSRIKEYPVIINNYNSINTTISTDIKNTYINNGDTITTYNYTTNDGDNITINYSVDGDGMPTGYIDLNPDANVDFNFDDLFDMFNTILAPLVGVGLDLPDWDTYLPPVVTGGGGDTYINNGDIVNVDGDYYNVDFPSFTGEYPAETITPIDSDINNIVPVDSLPQLPSLTGIDNGESAAVLGSSFTFLDGCGLLMPFVTIAIIRLLISKFRGDS